jgi:hypothetical protein
MKALWTACALLFVSAPLASAGSGGLNLGWTDCGGSPASLNRTFACSTNTGSFTLVGSFVTPSSVTAASGIVSIMDMQTAGVLLPPWWGMATGLCRAGSLTANFDFTNGPWSCIDYWQGGASGAVTMDPPQGNRARIRVVATLPAGSPLITSIPEGDEVYAFKVIIDAARTTGLGACAGCQREAVICFTSVTITQPAGAAGGNRYVWQPASRSYATWQGGGYVTDYCFPDPVRSTTWGSIKTLYR